MKKTLCLILALIAASPLFAADSLNVKSFVPQWLLAGPMEVLKPAFSDRPNLKEATFDIKEMLEALNLPETATVRDGNMYGGKFGVNHAWKPIKTDTEGEVSLVRKKTESHEAFVMAAFLDVTRFSPLDFEVVSPIPFALYLNGERIAGRNTASKPEKAEAVKANSKIEPGKHLVLLKLLAAPDSIENIAVSVRYKQKEGHDQPLWSLNPVKRKNIGHVLEGVRVSGVQLSPDGKRYLISYAEVSPPEGNRKQWHEILDFQSNTHIYSFRHAGISQLKFHPQGRGISYLAGPGDNRQLLLFDPADGSETVLLSDTKDFGSYHWSPDGSKLLYTLSERDKPDEKKLRKIEGMPDRWPWYRTRSQLYLLDIKTGFTQPLTHGYLGSSFMDFSPDGKRILFTQSMPVFNERPYSRQLVMEMNLSTNTVDTLWTSGHGAGASYSPEGKRLLVTGSAALFDGAGNALPEGLIPNDYDTQAYIYNLETKQITPITRSFKPKILEAQWSRHDGKIYFRTEDKTLKTLYVFDPVRNKFDLLPARAEIVLGFDIAHSAPSLVYHGNSIQEPEKAFSMNTRNLSGKLLSDPEKEVFADVLFGQTKEWQMTASTGQTVYGQVYYPPGFDAERKYPMIVYYYGGTNPVDRAFRGRYPKNYFAAHDYVVLVLNPSGATGYGQEYAALHVNNWGITVADEIIEGTKAFLDQHPYIDRDAVGNIGASYGGFMTMLLSTRTDIFAASISHAGISSISSYWGEGYWGYLYSSAATADNFPWNNHEIYVEQSPLFNADKVNTPLLLLHGDRDTNVPPGESIQMYTALKLLGKTVEYIEVPGQDHTILDYRKRILWQKTIMSWFDKWLKNQPEWWDELYPERKL